MRHVARVHYKLFIEFISLHCHVDWQLRVVGAVNVERSVARTHSIRASNANERAVGTLGTWITVKSSSAAGALIGSQLPNNLVSRCFLQFAIVMKVIVRNLQRR